MKQIKVTGLGLQTNNFCPANLKKIILHRTSKCTFDIIALLKVKVLYTGYFLELQKSIYLQKVSFIL